MATSSKNPFTWIEIYVEDMDRARKFYESVFQIKMLSMQTPSEFGDLEMWCFPWAEEAVNISGALCKTSENKPSGGTLAYFTCEYCAIEASRVSYSEGQILQDKIPIGEHGFCNIIVDTEGNTTL
ncbi:putative enzyme related to lactoylglutathione lyase [Algoriphagus sp. 4150]|uniref:VOC family protein n=1 Tax=Algoriphagus sp. 4150 TaxID=2817756 RepID=UPI002860B1A0|nr:VOC family protein [Algoriphagus sp. 4150]MDR7129451.1 putative enzyme related to lactoylglutathione lyase [Algoriphagus sp. 4150]